MIRRRLRKREIPFSFDSFLDVVANVVGIIIRLILVAWVGARAYTGLHVTQSLSKEQATATPAIGTPLSHDSMEDELAKRRRELEEARARLLAQLKQLELANHQKNDVAKQLAFLESEIAAVEQKRNTIKQAAHTKEQVALVAHESLDDLRARQRRLMEEIQDLEKMPPLKKVLHYRVPVSQPVEAEQFMFECRGGRVTFVDLTSMVADIKANMEGKAQALKNHWSTSDVTAPVGAFRLKYTVERQRDSLDGDLAGQPAPDANRFSYAVSQWEVEPVMATRGETLEHALRPTSEFRQLVDRLDPEQTVVTFWVYADSFPLYRRLRDYLCDRNLVVAGRPLPMNVPMMGSRSGTLSRGQ